MIQMSHFGTFLNETFTNSKSMHVDFSKILDIETTLGTDHCIDNNKIE